MPDPRFVTLNDAGSRVISFGSQALADAVVVPFTPASGSGSGTPGAITIDPTVTRSGNNYTFTARRTTNLSSAEARAISVAGSTTYPPPATAADFGGNFPSATAAFAAGSATATFTIASPIAQPE